MEYFSIFAPESGIPENFQILFRNQLNTSIWQEKELSQ